MHHGYPYENFYHMIKANAASHPDKTVLFIDDTKRSHAQLLKKVDAFARFLEEAGIVRGDRVALIAPNCEEFVVTVFAASKLGAVAVPVNNMLKASEFEYILNDCGAKLLVTAKKFIHEVSGLRVKTAVAKTVWIDEAPQFSENDLLFESVMHLPDPHRVHKYAPVGLDDLAVIFYTSGTTGH